VTHLTVKFSFETLLPQMQVQTLSTPELTRVPTFEGASRTGSAQTDFKMLLVVLVLVNF
jgi:hypothetical protein